ncbi:MAG: hypothetical protein FWG58_02230 [Methanomassiliicoccaceae archaeon]|nr:hypothetical protein [Methanomassiliicoccaceae archaeon]
MSAEEFFDRLSVKKDSTSSVMSLIAFMTEKASCAIIEKAFGKEKNSSGDSMELERTVDHVAGNVFRVSVTVTSVRGNTILFKISAKDDVREIFKGTHERTISEHRSHYAEERPNV